MTIQRELQKCLANWKQISGLDFCLIDDAGSVYLNTGKKNPPKPSVLDAFRLGDDEEKAEKNCSLYKIHEGNTCTYLLAVFGTPEESLTIGRLAVCQVESLLAAYAQKNDKNTFIQKLLLGSCTIQESLDQARRLHIDPTADRVVFYVRTKREDLENALTTIRSIFTSRSRDFITAVDENSIVIVRELTAPAESSDLYSEACMLVDMLGTEAMAQSRVSYSNTAKDLRDLPAAYKEACTAMEIGKIFYAEKNVFCYRELGIGRLIHQLPVSVCEMFIEEVFGNESPDSLDSETLTLIRTFFENNLNLSETSRQLYMHRNTLVYRFEKIQKKYGLDIRNFEDALTFKLALLVNAHLKSL